MTAFTTEKIDVEPWFDMELFMGVSQETRLGGDVMDRFMTLWKNWLPHLTVKGIDTGKIKYLLVALDESVEQDVDKAWEGSPSNAFLYNALAQTMCMAAVHAVIPEVQDAGCAPAPKPTATLREALEEDPSTDGIDLLYTLDVVEDMDLGAEQMDKIYDTLENLGIDTVGEDYIPELPDDEPAAEEIADVGIMLDQMAIEFEVEDAVAEQRAHKVRRLRSRLEYVEQEG